MRADQILVAAVATSLGTLSLVAAATGWALPYRLRSLAAVQRKWGQPAARGVLLLVGLLLLALAAVIALDLRPAYHSQ
ncbi:hypothetical protein [Roseimaritima ulvae]|uniref:Uncharacterized protein n=1 Tax=Roseimaritima ulvae TaxID=980254 RepID=A0A5B9QRC7_9BACT|nr:hypothetical protein [Roseimaritima ulvae]QEG40220.1 hypothetical protein UC8_22270 [Roseimaritima ulvae]